MTVSLLQHTLAEPRQKAMLAMDASKRTPRIAIDWQRLLGFDQTTRQDDDQAVKLANPRMAKVGAKIGSKTGIKSS